MTFVIRLGQALGCATELHDQGSDSAGRNKQPASIHTGHVAKPNYETKKEQIRISFVFQIFDTPCQTRTKKVQTGAGITDCPAFIDDQGVMYHGSE
ncbi:MAG: hypothetical protein ABJB10_15505, partial [Mesorhizobium sp.]